MVNKRNFAVIDNKLSINTCYQDMHLERQKNMEKMDKLDIDVMRIIEMRWTVARNLRQTDLRYSIPTTLKEGYIRRDIFF